MKRYFLGALVALSLTGSVAYASLKDEAVKSLAIYEAFKSLVPISDIFKADIAAGKSEAVMAETELLDIAVFFAKNIEDAQKLLPHPMAEMVLRDLNYKTLSYLKIFFTKYPQYKHLWNGPKF